MYTAEVYVDVYVKKKKYFLLQKILKIKVFYDTKLYLLQNTFGVKSMPNALTG